MCLLTDSSEVTTTGRQADEAVCLFYKSTCRILSEAKAYFLLMLLPHPSPSFPDINQSQNLNNTFMRLLLQRQKSI